MKNIAGILAVLVLLAQPAVAAERNLPIAGQKKPKVQEQLPPNAIPQIPDVPAEFFTLKGECSKEEGKALDAFDKRLLDISRPDLVNMNRNDRETMEFLNDPAQLRAMVDLYTRCGRSPQMHPLDPSTYEKDMKDLEKANR